jgi:formylglycine-generating enzyme required for sulfatase activity/predicted Ser/Thr protein kinase
MESQPQDEAASVSLAQIQRADRVCDQFEAAWKAKPRPKIDDFLAEVPRAEWPYLLRELLVLDLDYRRQLGESPTLEEYQAQYAALEFDRFEGLFAVAPQAVPAIPAETTLPLTPSDTEIPGAQLPRIRYMGDYELLAEIARGGMGVVYKARQISLNRVVAVKMILAGQFATQADHDRFHSESQAAALLDHPNIVPIFEVGEHEGQHYFSMGYVDGPSLAARLAEGPLPPNEAAELLTLVAEAVEYAHRQGVIHRDIKPSNILIDNKGRPRVTDFGVAKRVDSGSNLTATGQVLGTPSYMPPEQAAGKIDAVGPPADVYALGALLYAALTGHPPFQAATPLETLQQVIEREPVALRQLNAALPCDLETITLKCLEKSVPRRYATAHALREDLRRYLEGRPILARPVGRLERAWRWSRRQPVVAGLAAATVLLMILVAVTSTVGYVSTSRALQRVEDAQRDRALAQVYALRSAEISQVPYLIDGLKPFRDEVVPQFRQSLQQPDLGERERLRLSLAIVAEDEGLVAYLSERLLTAEPAELLVIRAALLPYRDKLAAGMWQIVDDPAVAKDRRFRAVCALAALDPASPRWANAAQSAAEALVAENPLVAIGWIEALRPVRQSLLPTLRAVFHNRRRGDSERSMATGILAEYASDNADLLAALLADADAKQFALLYAALGRLGDKAPAALQRELVRDCEAAAGLRPLAPSWSQPPQESVREIESADGVFTERWAFCQTMPLEKFAFTAESLRAAGYRPAWFQSYVVNNTARIAAVWDRDGRVWKQVLAASAAEVQRLDKEFQAKRLVPACLSELPRETSGRGTGVTYLAAWAGPSDDPQGSPDAGTMIGLGPAYVPMAVPWMVRFYGWPSAGPNEPPADWNAVIKSTVLHEQKLSALNFYWGAGAPYPAVPANNFALIATAVLELGGGKYYLRTASQDGIRVFFDDKQVLENWRAHVTTVDSAEFSAGSGKHLLRVEYFKIDHDATLEVAIFPEKLVLISPGEDRNRSRRPFVPAGEYDYADVPALPPASVKVSRKLWLPLGYRPRSMSLQNCAEGAQPTIALLCSAPIVSTATDIAAFRMATAAVALLRIGRAEQVWPLFKLTHDPSARSWIIHRLVLLGADPRIILRRLEKEKDVSARRALILCLGEFGPDSLPAADRDVLLPRLLTMYRDDPDAGIHAAAEWFLRQWKLQATTRQIDRQLATAKREGSVPRPAKSGPVSAATDPGQPAEAATTKPWYVNGQGDTMVILWGPVEFMMGSSKDERDRQADESLHRERIAYSFAIASKEVTVAQFKQFMPDFGHSEMRRSPEPDCPIPGVTWYEAAAYCNWLSKREGIPENQWCYLVNDSGNYADGMKLAAGWSKRTGYRLPSEAEWEYACRAGVATNRYYGWTEKLLDKYAWYSATTKDDRTFPVATLKPNDFGLFDMLGNEGEWCQDLYGFYADSAKGAGESGAAGEIVTDRNSRMLRGGAFISQPSYVRCAFRPCDQPCGRNNVYGFRVARTCN